MKLGDLGTFKTGGTPSRSQNEYWGDKYPWISSTALGDVYIDENAATDWISDEGLKNSSTKLIKANSLMIGIRIGVGKCSINRIPMCTSQDVVSIEGIDTERYYLPYITTLINNKRHYLESLKRGATIQGITTDIIKNLQIPDIQINRQKLIADTIQVVDDMVCLSHKQLAKLDTLVKSRFIEMFGDPVTNPMGWEVKKLKDISRKISDGVHAKPEYTGEGKPFLSVVNINKGKIDFSNCKFVSQSDYEKMIKSTNPEKGDVLYTKVGATYGIPAYVDTDENFCLYVSVCLIKPRHELVNARFLTESMRLPYIKHQADRRIRGIGVPDLHLNQISEFDVLCPPKELQERYIDFVTQVDKSKSVLQNLLEKQELLRAALMQEYFG